VEEEPTREGGHASKGLPVPQAGDQPAAGADLRGLVHEVVQSLTAVRRSAELQRAACGTVPVWASWRNG